MSYDAVLEQALEASQAKERELADQVASLRAKDLKRVKRIQALNQELAKAYNNIGELNSMIAHGDQEKDSLRRANRQQAGMIATQEQKIRELERTLAPLRKSHENQALTIAEQGNTIFDLNLEKASLEGLINDLRQDLREAPARSEVQGLRTEVFNLRENLNKRTRDLNEALAMIQEPDDDAPNLALAACRKKLKQLGGMLEAQRRSTRELAVNLQRVRDERTRLRADRDIWKERAGTAEALKKQWIQAEATANDLETAKKRAQVAETRAQTMEAQRNEQYQRNVQTVQERDQYLKDLQDLQRRVNRAKSILAPTVLRQTWYGDTRITSSLFSTETGMAGVTVTPQAKKAEPRKCEASFPGVHGGHRCERPGGHWTLTTGTDHRCHCGWSWS